MTPADVARISFEGKTALQYARAQGFTAIAKMIMDHQNGIALPTAAVVEKTELEKSLDTNIAEIEAHQSQFQEDDVENTDADSEMDSDDANNSESDSDKEFLRAEIGQLRQLILSMQSQKAKTAEPPDGHETDDEDETDLQQQTKDLCQTEYIAYAPTLWKKPADAKPGVRELTRTDLSGHSASLYNLLRVKRGENVVLTKDRITVQLATP